MNSAKNLAGADDLPEEVYYFSEEQIPMVPMSMDGEPLVAIDQASFDLFQLDYWARQFLDCNWGVPLGHDRGLLGIRLRGRSLAKYDHDDSFATFRCIRRDHSEAILFFFGDRGLRDAGIQAGCSEIEVHTDGTILQLPSMDVFLYEGDPILPVPVHFPEFSLCREEAAK